MTHVCQIGFRNKYVGLLVDVTHICSIGLRNKLFRAIGPNIAAFLQSLSYHLHVTSFNPFFKRQSSKSPTKLDTLARLQLSLVIYSIQRFFLHRAKFLNSLTVNFFYLPRDLTICKSRINSVLVFLLLALWFISFLYHFQEFHIAQ